MTASTDPGIRRFQLRQRYGAPVRVDTAGVLRAAHGLRRSIHPRDAAAFRYPSPAAAEAYSEANREFWGHTVLGPYETEVGPVVVVDLRPALVRAGAKATDPALPDQLP